MAKLEQGILGPFRGTVGTVIGYRWRDRWCMRAVPRHYHDRQSEAQLTQRSRFKAMIQFASPATPLLRIGLRAWAAEHGLTEGNAFLKLNHQWFGGDAGNSRDSRDSRDSGNSRESRNSREIDYSRLRFSHGHLPGVRLTGAEVDGAGVATVQWSKEGGRNEDRVHLYAYGPASGTGLLVATVERGRRRARFLLPQQMVGAEVHLWAVAENAAGEVSPTAYLPLDAGEDCSQLSPDVAATASNTGDYDYGSAAPTIPAATEGSPLQSAPPPLPPGEAMRSFFG